MSLANRFGASRTTVIKALNELELRGVIFREQGKGTFVQRRTDDRQKGQSADRKPVVSFITPFHDASLAIETELIRGIEGVVKETGGLLSVKFSEEDPDLELRLMHLALDFPVDGIILYPCTQSRAFVLVSRLVTDGYPIVLIEKNVFYGLPVAAVLSDNLTAGRVATAHLIENDYDEVFYVSSSPINQLSSIRDRFLGFGQAIRSAGRHYREEHVVELPQEVHAAIVGATVTPNDAAIVQTIHRMRQVAGSRRIGVFAVTDSIAVTFLRAARRLGLSTPDEIGFVGVGDEDAAATESLTTVRQDYYRIGRLAAEEVRGMLGPGQGPRHAEAHGDRLVPVSLVARATTGSPDGCHSADGSAPQG